MQEYTDIRTTPLRFHMFFWKIWIPVQVILGGWSFGKLTADFQNMDMLTTIDAGYYLISGVLFAMVMGGFFRWKRNALISLFAQMAINIVYAFAMYIIAAGSNGDTGFALSALIGTLIRCIPVGIYYYKRRKLFVPGGYTKEQMEAINRGADNSFSGSFRNSMQNSTRSTYSSYTTQYSNAEENITDAEGIKRVCPHCGRQLPNNPNFCIYCGGKLK